MKQFKHRVDFHLEAPKNQYESLFQSTLGVEAKPIRKKKFKNAMKVLDAPNLCIKHQQLLSWNSSEIISLALGPSLYVRNFVTEVTQHIHQSASMISSIKFTEEVLMAGNRQGLFRVFDVLTKNVLREYELDDQVNYIDCLNHVAAIGCQKRGLLIFDLRQKEYGFSVGQWEKVLQVRVNGTLYAVGTESNIQVWDIRNFKHRAASVNQSGKVISWSQNKVNNIMIGGNEMRIWNMSTLESVNLEQSISNIITTSDLVLCSDDNVIHCYDKYFQYKHTFQKHSGRILEFMENKGKLCSVGEDELLVFWELL